VFALDPCIFPLLMNAVDRLNANSKSGKSDVSPTQDGGAKASNTEVSNCAQIIFTKYGLQILYARMIAICFY
jgi:hypothetical protein